MTVDAKALQAKITDMYPDIAKNGIQLSVNFDATQNAWMVKMTKGGDSLETHLEAADAEACVSGTECVHLTTQIAQFVEAYCLRGDSCDS